MDRKQSVSQPNHKELANVSERHNLITNWDGQNHCTRQGIPDPYRCIPAATGYERSAIYGEFTQSGIVRVTFQVKLQGACSRIPDLYRLLLCGESQQGPAGGRERAYQQASVRLAFEEVTLSAGNGIPCAHASAITATGEKCPAIERKRAKGMEPLVVSRQYRLLDTGYGIPGRGESIVAYGCNHEAIIKRERTHGTYFIRIFIGLWPPYIANAVPDYNGSVIIDGSMQRTATQGECRDGIVTSDLLLSGI